MDCTTSFALSSHGAESSDDPLDDQPHALPQATASTSSFARPQQRREEEQRQARANNRAMQYRVHTREERMAAAHDKMRRWEAHLEACARVLAERRERKEQILDASMQREVRGLEYHQTEVQRRAEAAKQVRLRHTALQMSRTQRLLPEDEAARATANNSSSSHRAATGAAASISTSQSGRTKIVVPHPPVSLAAAVGHHHHQHRPQSSRKMTSLQKEIVLPEVVAAKAPVLPALQLQEVSERLAQQRVRDKLGKEELQAIIDDEIIRHDARRNSHDELKYRKILEKKEQFDQTQRDIKRKEEHKAAEIANKHDVMMKHNIEAFQKAKTFLERRKNPLRARALDRYMQRRLAQLQQQQAQQQQQYAAAASTASGEQQEQKQQPQQQPTDLGKPPKHGSKSPSKRKVRGVSSSAFAGKRKSSPTRMVQFHAAKLSSRGSSKSGGSSSSYDA